MTNNNFPTWGREDNTYGTGTGFGDAGLKTFQDKPIISLAKELIQNSLDAPKKSGVPVRVEFNIKEIDPGSFPDKEILKGYAESCRKFAEDQLGHEVAGDYFRKTLGLYKSKSKIQILEVADYQTTGLLDYKMAKDGESFLDFEDTPFGSYIKTQGKSIGEVEADRDDRSRLGSHGVGKFAGYVMSDIQGVFCSSIFKNNENKIVQCTMGRVILMSHKDDDGSKYKSYAFWGEDEARQFCGIHPTLPVPLQRRNSPEELTEENIGTSVSVLYLRDEEYLQDLLIAAAISNYFGAIMGGYLELNICGVEITRNNLMDCFNSAFTLDVVKDKADGLEDLFTRNKWYAECLSDDPAIITKVIDDNYFGEVKVSLLLRDGAHKAVCLLRDGMFINDKPMPKIRGGWGAYRDFVAVMQCLDATPGGGVDKIRALENVAHDSLDAERVRKNYETTEEADEAVQEARNALRRLGGNVRAFIGENCQEDLEDSIVDESLSDYLPIAVGDSAEEEEEDLFSEVMIEDKKNKSSKAKLSTRSQPQGDPGDDLAPGDEDQEVNDDEKFEKGDGKSKWKKKRKKRGGSTQKRVTIDKFRISHGDTTTKVSFSTPVAGSYSIGIYPAGAESVSNEKSIITECKEKQATVKIKKDDNGNFQSGWLELDLEEGKACALEIVLHGNYKDSLMIRGYQNPEQQGTE